MTSTKDDNVVEEIEYYASSSSSLMRRERKLSGKGGKGGDNIMGSSKMSSSSSSKSSGSSKTASPAPSMEASEAPSMGPSLPPNFFMRMLGEIEYVDDLDRIRSIIEEKQADPNGTYIRRDGLLTKLQCDTVKKFMDETHETDMSIDPYEVHRANLPRFAHYNILITPSKLVELIGLESTKTLVDFYHEALGYKAPVTKIKLQLSWNMNRQEHFTYHIDRKSSMIVFLGPNEDEPQMADENGVAIGGGLAYLNETGLNIEPMVPGSGIVHGPIVLHGAEGWIGKRYIIDILSYPDAEPEDCLFEQYFAAHNNNN